MATLQRSVERGERVFGAIVRPAWRALLCAAGLLASAPLLAQGYPPRDVGDWTVAVSKDGKGCFLTRAYDHPGSTTLLLGLDLDGANHLSLLNENWSIKPKDQLKLNFTLSNGGYPGHFAIGIASDGKQGFVTSFETRFPTYLAGSKILNVSRGKVPVERLDLEGSGAAVAELRHCVEAQRGEPGVSAGEKPSSGTIPKDPFAPAPVRKPKK
jgi:hypothetical protein